METGSLIYYYPMSSDILNSFFQSETESQTSVRFLNSSGRKIWLANKLIRNILLGRKTLILLKPGSDLDWIHGVLAQFQMESSAFFWHVSKIKLDEELTKYDWASNYISKDNKSLALAELHLIKAYNDIKHYIRPFDKDAISENSKLLYSFLKFKKSTNNIQFPFITLNDNFLEKSYTDLKTIMQNAPPELALYTTIAEDYLLFDPHFFELFLVDDAWTYFQDQVKSMYEKILLTSIEITQYQNNKNLNNYLSKKSEWQKITTSLEKLNLIKEKSIEENIEIDLLKSQARQFKLAIGLQDSEEITERLLFQIIEKQNVTTDIYKEKEFIEKLNAYLIDLNNNFQKSGLLRKDIWNRETSLHTLEKRVKSLATKLYTLLSSKENFNVFYYSNQFLQSHPASDQAVLKQLFHLPINAWVDCLWHNILHQKLSIQQIPQQSTAELLLENYKNQLLQYKKTLKQQLKYSRHKEHQHTITEIKTKIPSWLESLEYKNTSNASTPAEYFEHVDLLSKLFPIQFIQNSTEQISDLLSHFTYDELWNLNEELGFSQKLKISRLAYHHIDLRVADDGISSGESALETKEFNTVANSINLTIQQSPPEFNAGLLNPDSKNFNLKQIKHFAHFISANFPNIHIYINAQYCIFSLLPEKLNLPLIEISGLQLRMVELPSQDIVNKITECLINQHTKKIIWSLDEILNPKHTEMPHIEWQLQCRAIFEEAGLQVESFSLQDMIDNRYCWYLQNIQSLKSSISSKVLAFEA